MSTFTDTANISYTELNTTPVEITLPDMDEFVIPDLTTTTPSLIDITNLTTGSIDGNGAFDLLMASINDQLNAQFKSGKITHNNYGEVYVQSLVQAMTIALQFITTKEQTYLNNILLNEQVKQGKIQTVIIKLAFEKAKLDIKLTELSIKKENANLILIKSQLSLSKIEYDLKTKQLEVLDKEIEAKEKQILLYQAQIDAYTQDNKYKVANMYATAYSIAKTSDEATVPPEQFTNAEINEVLTAVRDSAGLT